ncbi:MAG: FKBP-type peptidyl-prolyl cis-trans isomerase [Prevotellaceae bacterium]|jgi:FKBP-type peptidyl-prolyl cis-trans isomerase|nr:FKBP-type peptidyl-prolyl cis-trans isomerase [Prevotellaceae bacterium]
MKNILFFLLLGTFLSVQAAPKKAAKSTMKSSLDSVSYAFGMQVGGDLRKNLETIPGGPLQTDLFIEAMTKELKADTANLLLDRTKIMEVIQTYLMKAEADQAKKAETENNLFFENNKKNKNVVTTASGLQYEVLTQGNGAQPKATDKVKVHYHGTLTDGTVFDSSIERGTPIEFDLDKVIPGWTEGVQLMSVGSKYRFFIPPALAYGSRATGKIKPNSILIFDVELLDVTPAQETNNGAKFQFEPYQKSN